jgi:hypothetical protein
VESSYHPERDSTKTRPVTRCGSLTAAAGASLVTLLAGISSGSGSARLGLSQKGDLPSSGEPQGICRFKVADARSQKEKAPASADPASRLATEV